MKIKFTVSAAAGCLLAATPAIAQDNVGEDLEQGAADEGQVEAPLASANVETSPVAVSAAPAPIMVQSQAQVTGNAVLPANTEVILEMNQDVTTKGDSWAENDTFNLTVVEDVSLGDYVVIPRGTGAVGRITWMTSKGMFGKSGKMDVELEYLELQGRRIPINGTYRQEGEGSTLATVGGVVLVGVFAGFITGKSALIPQDRELVATTEDDIVLQLPASAIRRAPTAVAPLAGSAAAAQPVATLAAPVSQEVEVAAEPADAVPSEASEEN